MRSKEFAHDYRYFPDPDLLPLTASAALVEQVRAAMPELPDAKRARFVSEYGIAEYDAGVLTATRALADYFEAVARAGAPATCGGDLDFGGIAAAVERCGQGDRGLSAGACGARGIACYCGARRNYGGQRQKSVRHDV